MSTAAGSPSSWRRRAPVIAVSAIGLLIASYLTAFQLGWLHSVWEPFFGTGSEAVLNSQLAQALPVPDAALGVAAYVVDIVLELIGDEQRWRTRPTFVVGFGLVLICFAIASVGLVLIQLFVIKALCTLCLASAVISISLPFMARDEVSAAWHEMRQSNSKEVA